ncbi:MAG TPA: phosphoenolpyruvate--protein phosphotransferase [Actinocrinis sp.]
MAGEAPAGPARGRLTGLGVGSGAVAGPAALMSEPPGEPSPAARPQGGPADEARRALAALAEAAAELNRRAARAGGEAAEILEAQAMMAEDPTVADAVRLRTEAGLTGERAIYEAFAEYRALLAEAGEYLAARAADLDDVAMRAICACMGVPMPGVPDPGVPFVLVARDLAPADTALLDLDRVLAVVTEQGGPTSHTAILARGRGIPAVVGAAGALGIAEGTAVLVDAAAGTVTTHPTPDELAELEQRSAARAAAAADKGPGRTADGVHIRLLANIGGPGDVAKAVAVGAEGVGLFRTEFLYLDSATPPTLEAQAAVYREVLAGFPGQRVVVRTLDAGADKPLPFLPLGEEPNPALGVRGLRAFTGEFKDLLETQLRALAAAKAGLEDDAVQAAELWVMAPMVADGVDAAWFADLAHAHGLPVAGVMIEVPSAALCAEAVLAAADFASLGTNDLTQYALAADRMSGPLGPLQDPWHPAVLKLVELTGAAGAALGKPVGVCGEAAADPGLAPVLVGLGVSSLSMASTAIPEVRAALSQHTMEQCRELAARALGAAPRRTL